MKGGSKEYQESEVIKGENKFTKDDERRGVALYCAGLSLRAAAKEIGCTHQQIKLWVLEHAPERYRSSKDQLNNSADTGKEDLVVMECFKLLQAGVSPEQIADQLDLSLNRIHYLVRLRTGRTEFDVMEIEVPNVGILKEMTLEEARAFCLEAVSEAVFGRQPLTLRGNGSVQIDGSGSIKTV